MYVTESELREVWRDGKGLIPRFPRGTRFSPAALDFLQAHGIRIEFTGVHSADQSAETSLPGGSSIAAGGRDSAASPGLNARPFDGLRLRLESLHAAILLSAAQARRFQLPDLSAHLNTLAEYCGQILAAVGDGRRMPLLRLAGLSSDQIRQIGQWPEKHLGIPPVVAGPADHEILLWLNFLRALAGATAQAAVEADGRPDVGRAVDSLAAAVYYLALLFSAGRLAWRLPGGG